MVVLTSVNLYSEDFVTCNSIKQLDSEGEPFALLWTGFCILGF